MSNSRDNFKFILYPKTLIIKGIYKQKLPQFSISVLKSNYKEDQLSSIPSRDQKLYQTYFIFQEETLQFNDNRQNRLDWHQRELVFHEHGQELARMKMDVEDYVANYEEYASKYYSETVKISSTIDFQYQLFVGTSDSELSQLIFDYKGQSHIKTPLTLESKRDEQDIFDRMLLEKNMMKSEVYSPTILPIPRIKSVGKNKEDDQESIAESVPLTAPPKLKKGFSINLKAVPTLDNKKISTKQTERETINILQEFWFLPWKDKLTFLIIASITVASVYISMTPIKKI